MMSEDRYCLIDLSGIFRTHWSATAHKPRNEAYARTLHDVAEGVSGYQSANVAICCDTRAPTFRHELSEEYKANRVEADHSLYDVLRDTEEALSGQYHVFRKDGFEADDICATLATFLSDAVPGVRVELVSTDKDTTQCVTDQVTWVTPQANAKVRRFDFHGFISHYGFRPGQFPHYQAFMGDKSDGYLGVFGIGPVKGGPLIQKYGTVSRVIEAVRDSYLAVEKLLGKKTTHNLQEAIADGSLLQGLKLATLRCDALDDDECRRLLGPVETTPDTEPAPASVGQLRPPPLSVEDEINALFNL